MRQYIYNKVSRTAKSVLPVFLSAFILFMSSCSEDTDIPTLPKAESATIAEGVELDPDRLFGTWEGEQAAGKTSSTYFEQSYRVEFLSVEDAEAVFSHWFVDAATLTKDSVCDVEYEYDFDGSSVVMTPKQKAANQGAATITAVYNGDDQMTLYTTQEGITTVMCTLTRTGDPEPTVTGVDRTLPQPGEVVTITGRNMQFVDHVYVPTANGEQEVDFEAISSREIKITVPDADCTAGSIRCQATGAHVSSFTPVMFCQDCVFFSNFSTQGTSRPYTGTEFENTINITQSLFDKYTVVSSDNLPAGHALTLEAAQGIVNPQNMLCIFGNTPVNWAVDTGLDPGTGMLRFSFGDRLRYVINNSNGLVTESSKCSELAIEMDIYVTTDGEPVWNTGFISFRLDKDQGKSLTQGWFAQTAMWDASNPVSFADGWKTFTIPMSAIAVTSNDAYSTAGKLSTYLINGKKQAIIKMLNYQLDANHPATASTAVQFCIANMRVVPYGVPRNIKE